MERHNKNSPHSALFKSSNLDDTRALFHGLKILFYNFSDIKLSLIKIIYILYYLPYSPEKTNYNVKNMPLIYGVVQCVADRVWWAALCQKVQGHFLAPVRPCLAPTSTLVEPGLVLYKYNLLNYLPYYVSGKNTAKKKNQNKIWLNDG